MDGAPQVGTRTVLFTDVVGSTELRVRLGEEAADALRRAHDAVLTEAVAARGGMVVKGLGDGIMVTFESASDAVAAAVAVQQSAEAHGRRVPGESLAVRVGVSIGDVSSEDGDVFGVPVVEASRLCAAAAGGEVLVAELVRALTRGRGGFVYEPMGDLVLKGLPEAVPVCRVVWEPLDSAFEAEPGGVPIAAALLGPAATSYVGRRDLRDRLVGEWHQARVGACRTILLAGEPGVGKTRTAAEIARAALGEGALVLYGRCDEGLGAPYQPFVEALQHYVNHADAPLLGRLRGELRRLVPDLGQGVGTDEQPVVSDPASEKHRLFEACASWLVEAARTSGLVLVIDDIHWASKPTLLLLQHVVRTACHEGAPILLLGTYRDTDLDRAHPLAECIGDLRRLPGVDRVTVDNLSSDEVEALIATAAGHDIDEPMRRMSEVVFAETDGNPFFVGEVLRHLVETGGVRREDDRWVLVDPEHVVIPEGVRDVVGRRVNRLSTTANDVLSLAAVIGRSFDVACLVAVAQLGESDVLDALDEAVRARLVEEVGVDDYRFAHALVRTTLYDELSATRCRRLHRRIADVLEELRPDDVRALSHHCTEGGSDGGDMSRAVHYTLAAAEESLAVRAFADAESRFRDALDLLHDSAEPMSRSWVVAQCGLGEAQRDQGDPAFGATLLAASRRAVELEDTALLVRAVLANTRGAVNIVADIDHDRLSLVEQALDLVGPAACPERARLIGQRAAELTFSGDNTLRLTLADESIGMARELGDDVLLGGIIVATNYAAVAGSRWPSLVERTAEGVRLADLGVDPVQRVFARIFASSALLTAGHFESSRRVTLDMRLLAEAEGSPLIRWFVMANSSRLTSLGGDLDEADRTNDEMLALGIELEQADAEQWWAGTALGIQWLRGNGGLLVEPAAAFAEALPLSITWRVVQAWTLALAGRLPEARAALRGATLDPVQAREEPFPFTATFLLADTAWRLHDVDLAAGILASTDGDIECWAHYYTFVLGPLVWARGLAQATVGDADAAVGSLEHALSELTLHKATAHLPTIQLQLAQILLQRAGPHDAERGAALLESARLGATAIGAPLILERIEALAT